MAATNARTSLAPFWIVVAGVLLAALLLIPPPHAIERHGVDAVMITDAYNQGAPCHEYESMYYNRRMKVIQLGPLNGLIFTTKYGTYITAYLRSPERTAKLIVRDGYVPVCEK
jgi:hypothetical protein